MEVVCKVPLAMQSDCEICFCTMCLLRSNPHCHYMARIPPVLQDSLSEANLAAALLTSRLRFSPPPYFCLKVSRLLMLTRTQLTSVHLPSGNKMLYSPWRPKFLLSLITLKTRLKWLFCIVEQNSCFYQIINFQPCLTHSGYLWTKHKKSFWKY